MIPGKKPKMEIVINTCVSLVNNTGKSIFDQFKDCKMQTVVLRDKQNFKRGMSKRGDQM